nr:flavodoxin [Enterococcus plantarum]
MTAIIYFSRAFENLVDGKKKNLYIGNTKLVALKIAEELNAEAVEIIPKIMYPKEYQRVVMQAEQEKETNERPIYQPIAINLEHYRAIYLGYPNWWGTLPMVMATFLEEHNFLEKIFILFVHTKAVEWGIVSVIYRNYVRILGFILVYLFVVQELKNQILQSKIG